MNATIHNPLLSVESLSFKVNDLEILRDINLSIDDKEFVCIVGASGCGKTTLLRMMAGLLSPTRGHVSYRGQQVVGPHREIAVVFQDYAKALLPWRTVVVFLQLSAHNAFMNYFARLDLKIELRHFQYNSRGGCSSDFKLPDVWRKVHSCC